MERGEHLLDALVEVVAAGGLGAASVRAVASAAGVSVAQVQYYFRTKDELVEAAYRHVSERLVRRVRDLDLDGAPEDVLRRVLHLWLPLDAERERDAKVWLAFAAAAPVSASLRPLSAEMDRELKRWLAEFAGVDEIEAALLLAVLDGLVVQSLVRPEPERSDLLVRGLDRHLERLFAAGGKGSGSKIERPGGER
ncbi:hypothetical protein GCM10010172_70550 [Paractinoplanes ferrugineus]|uniref:HTH tetR-type domain-containing protein n=1 Tax=Paractinoplanes ferrugineus TaxID=113564 RepID=A0A919J8B9_9ACTN|nr:TetR family transcriptional regulator C-terminal domain-containing protein [Actinoplanes ferrugineus]GIE12426.1 hypothetical protein Afe05nite_42660 [Actinoplanes ferrugineus]